MGLLEKSRMRNSDVVLLISNKYNRLAVPGCLDLHSTYFLFVPMFTFSHWYAFEESGVMHITHTSTIK